MSMVDVIRQLMGMPPRWDMPPPELRMFVTARFRDPDSPGIALVLFRFEGERRGQSCRLAGERMRAYCEARWASYSLSWQLWEERSLTVCVRVIDDYRLACYEAWIP